MKRLTCQSNCSHTHKTHNFMHILLKIRPKYTYIYIYFLLRPLGPPPPTPAHTHKTEPVCKGVNAVPLSVLIAIHFLQPDMSVPAGQTIKCRFSALASFSLKPEAPSIPQPHRWWIRESDGKPRRLPDVRVGLYIKSCVFVRLNELDFKRMRATFCRRSFKFSLPLSLCKV